MLSNYKDDIKPIPGIIGPIEESSTFQYEAQGELPEIEFNEPILPRALPPLMEGGEVFFEEV